MSSNHRMSGNNHTTADGAIGMMDAAYFIGRKELLDFFNDLLLLNLTKIEQTASGAIACQIIDILYPQTIATSKIHWTARTDYEYIQNYKLLQTAFTKCHIQRYIDVDKLIRGKYQDNLEFCQWLKAFYDQSIGNVVGLERAQTYDPIAVRAKGKGGIQYNKEMSRATGSSSGRGSGSGSGSGTTATGLTATSSRATTGSRPTTTTTTTTRPSSTSSSRPTPTTTTALTKTTTTTTTNPTKQQQQLPLKELVSKNNTTTTTTTSLPDKQRNSSDKVTNIEEIEEEFRMKEQEYCTTITELEQAIIDTEKERNFYFEKLRNIEILLQIYQEKQQQNVDNDDLDDTTTAGNNLQQQQHQQKTKQMVDSIFQLLYATADDDTTLIVNEDGDIVPMR